MAFAITESELLEALAVSQKPGADGARTVSEMAADAGIPDFTVRKALRKFQQQGRLTVYRVHRTAIDGSHRLIPAYSITKKKK